MARVYFFLVFVYIRYYQATPTFKRWLHWGRANTSINIKRCIL
jgi:hypothetical protein